VCSEAVIEESLTVQPQETRVLRFLPAVTWAMQGLISSLKKIIMKKKIMIKILTSLSCYEDSIKHGKHLKQCLQYRKYYNKH